MLEMVAKVSCWWRLCIVLCFSEVVCCVLEMIRNRGARVLKFGGAADGGGGAVWYCYVSVVSEMQPGVVVKSRCNRQ